MRYWRHFLSFSIVIIRHFIETKISEVAKIDVLTHFVVRSIVIAFNERVCYPTLKSPKQATFFNGINFFADLSRRAASGRSPAEILGSNPTGGMDICLL